MQLSHIPLPSFTLVLTSGHRSLYGDPIPAATDHWMKTIDPRYVPNDDNSAQFEDNESSADTQTIFELERPAASHDGAKRAGNLSFKSFVLLIHKFLVPKRRFTRN